MSKPDAHSIKHSVYHIVDAQQMATLRNAPYYEPASLADEGFIHLCYSHQVDAVLTTFYPTQSDLYLLLIDISLLEYTPVDEDAAGEVPTTFAALGQFPHLYGPLNTNAVVDVIEQSHFTSKVVAPETLAMLRHYRFKRIPLEGTLYTSTWRSDTELPSEGPVGTAMIGMYANAPVSISCFHKLDFDEVWHFYHGDPFTLYLLYPDGSTQEVVMGNDVLAGQHVQYRIPAGVWQAGCISATGRFAVFGCTMAPGFTDLCFEAGVAEDLTNQYPHMAEVIQQLSVTGDEVFIPAGFAQ